MRITIGIHVVLGIFTFLFGIAVAYMAGIALTLALILTWPKGLWLVPLLASLATIALLATPIGYQGGRGWYMAGFVGLATAYVYDWRPALIQFTLLLLGLSLLLSLAARRLRTWQDNRLNRPLRPLPETGFHPGPRAS